MIATQKMAIKSYYNTVLLQTLKNILSCYAKFLTKNQLKKQLFMRTKTAITRKNDHP